MHSLLNSLQPLFNRYRIEFIMVALSLVVLVSSVILFLNNQIKSDPVIKITESATRPSEKTIHIDIEGAVKNPGIYGVKENERLGDVIRKAGGLSKEADEYFFARTFNLAAILKDQEKIYIPAIGESDSPSQSNMGISTLQSSSDDSSLVNINTASRDELDKLPGIGPTTIDKLIAARPFNSIEDLVSKKILKSSVFEDIKDQLSL